jgi:hypothetical protein
MEHRSYTNSLQSVKRKNNKYFLSTGFIILLYVIAVMFSCNNPAKNELIVRKWKCENVEYSDTSKVSTKDNMDLEIVNGFMRNMIYEYFIDGHFEVLINDKTKKGTWRIDNEEKYLTLRYDKGKVRDEKYEIISMSDRQMKLKFNQERVAEMSLLLTFNVYTEKF